MNKNSFALIGCALLRCGTARGIRRIWRVSSGDGSRLQSIEMADTLYLSLWYPNLRLAGLADKLTAVLGAFAGHGGEARVYSATLCGR